MKKYCNNCGRSIPPGYDVYCSIECRKLMASRRLRNGIERRKQEEIIAREVDAEIKKRLKEYGIQKDVLEIEKQRLEIAERRRVLRLEELAYLNPVPLSTPVIGAIAELLVCANLLHYNWAAYRAVSPAAPCDLIAINGDKVYRVEVRTGQYSIEHLLSAPVRDIDIGRSDMMAIVVNRSKVYYVPDYITGNPTETNLSLVLQEYLASLTLANS